jgi:glycosyltransferase involved in cell wall biosynthesis
MRYVKTGVRLVLVGNGPDEDGLREQIERHGLQSRVELAGRVSDERLHELYLGALGVYYGPFDEDYGYVTLEGFAARRPVVTLTDAGGPLEFVTDGETGLVTPPEPQAIAHAFDRLFSNRPLAQKMGETGNEKLRATVPGWPEVVARLTE